MRVCSAAAALGRAGQDRGADGPVCTDLEIEAHCPLPQEKRRDTDVKTPRTRRTRSFRLPRRILRFARQDTRLARLFTHPSLLRAEGCLPPPLRLLAESVRMSLAIRFGHALVPAQALEQKLRDVLRLLADELGSESVGDYLEFGVYYGASMACMYRALRSLGLDHVRLFGFDSFRGLPSSAAEEDQGVWSPGQYACSMEFARKYLSRQLVDWNRVVLVQGWFRDTLTRQLLDAHSIRQAGVIMVDSDLSSSALAALSFCSSLIGPMCVIIFDDWYAGGLHRFGMGEKSAFHRFLSKNPGLAAEKLGGYCGNSEVFLVRRLT